MGLKITVLLIILSISNVLVRNSYSQSARILPWMNGEPLVQIIDEIEKQKDYYFIFNQKQIDINRVVDIQVRNEPLESNLVFLTIKDDPQQQITVTGKVTDSQTGEPMAGVNIVLKGTTIGTMTDALGNILQTKKYYTVIPSPEAQIWTLKTTVPLELTTNGYSDIKSKSPEIKFTLNGGNIEISSAAGSTYTFLPDGNSVFNQAKLLQNRKV